MYFKLLITIIYVNTLHVLVIVSWFRVNRVKSCYLLLIFTDDSFTKAVISERGDEPAGSQPDANHRASSCLSSPPVISRCSLLSVLLFFFLHCTLLVLLLSAPLSVAFAADIF